MTLRTSKPQSITETCVDILREDVLNGVYDAPRSFVIDRVAESLNVSHTPIREAVRKLEAEGLLEYNRGRGVLIRQLRREEYEELRTLRLAIEPILIRAACERVTDENIARARSLLEDWYVMTGSRSELFARQKAVLTTLYQTTGLVRTLEMHNSIQSLVARFHIFAWDTTQEVRKVDREFLAGIIDAIAVRNPARAVEIFADRLSWADGLVETKLAELS